MGTFAVFMLGVLYLVAGAIYFLIEALGFKKYKKIRMITYVRLMYALIYGIVPAIIYYHYYMTGEVPYAIDLTSQGLSQGYILFVLSVIGYACISFGYLIRFSGKMRYEKKQVEIRNLMMSGIIILVIGLTALYLWTRPFGSMFGIISHAHVLRAGRSDIYNPFAFLEELCPLLMFATYVFFALIVDKRKKKLMTLLPFCFSIFWAIVYLLSNDGRMMFVAFFVIFFLGIIRCNEAKTLSYINRNKLKIILLIFIAFYVMLISEGLLNYFKLGVYDASIFEIDALSAIRNELGYTIKSGQLSLTAYGNGETGNRIFGDFISAIFVWIPSGLISFDLTTMSLYEYNTSLLPYASATLPTDLIAMCIYDMGIFGIIVIPLIYGLAMRKIEDVFDRNMEQAYYNILYGVMVYYVARIIAYADLESIARAMFYILIGHVIVRVTSLINKRVVLSNNKTIILHKAGEKLHHVKGITMYEVK